jgi:hypothetical protein
MSHEKRTLRSLDDDLVKWLLDNQESDGGWGEHKGGSPSTFNTAEAVLALSVVAPVGEVGTVRKAINDAADFLRKDRENNRLVPPDDGAWCRGHDRGKQHKVTDILRTAMIVGALSSAGGNEKVIESAIDWLVKRQGNSEDDHGWGYQRKSKSEILPTCFVLLALISMSARASKNPWRQVIESGLRHLTEKMRNEDGSFGSGRFIGAHTAYSCLILQAARTHEFSTVAKFETQAIEWLLDHPDDAVRPIEEKIAIDPTGAANYQFMFTMEALLLRVLASSEDVNDRRTHLWLDIQRSMNDAFDRNTGGFYGRRVFSWSTANGLYAIRCSEDNLGEIPEREPEAEAPKGISLAGVAIMLFALVLVGVVSYLTIKGNFGTLQATFFYLLVLACLLAFGVLTEVSFKELVTSLTSLWKQKQKKSE